MIDRLTAGVAEVFRGLADRLDPFGKVAPPDQVLFITRLTPDLFEALLKKLALEPGEPIPFVEMRRMRRDWPKTQ